LTIAVHCAKFNNEGQNFFHEEVLYMGLDITAIGMTVVFIALIVLSLCIDIFGRLFTRKRSARNTELAVNNPNESRGIQTEPSSDNQIPEEELVAVITAAIQASLGLRDAGKRVVVKSFRRLPGSPSVWNVTGRMEQLGSKLV